MVRPVPESQTLVAREDALNESRDIQETLDAKRISAPMAEHYRKLGDALVDHPGVAIRTGCWPTGAYLTVPAADPGGFALFAGASRGLANGERSVPEAVRIIPDNHAATLAQQWG